MAVVTGDNFHRLFEKLAGDLPDLFRIDPVDDLPIPIDVRKQDSNVLAFAFESLDVRGGIVLQWCAALIAVSTLRWVRIPAKGTYFHRGTSAEPKLLQDNACRLASGWHLGQIIDGGSFVKKSLVAGMNQLIPDKSMQVKPSLDGVRSARCNAVDSTASEF